MSHKWSQFWLCQKQYKKLHCKGIETRELLWFLVVQWLKSVLHLSNKGLQAFEELQMLLKSFFTELRLQAFGWSVFSTGFEIFFLFYHRFQMFKLNVVLDLSLLFWQPTFFGKGRLWFLFFEKFWFNILLIIVIHDLSINVIKWTSWK